MHHPERAAVPGALSRHADLSRRDDNRVVPGDVLELHVRALRGGGRVWKFEGHAKVEGELACEATFMAMFDVPKA